MARAVMVGALFALALAARPGGGYDDAEPSAAGLAAATPADAARTEDPADADDALDDALLAADPDDAVDGADAALDEPAQPIVVARFTPADTLAAVERGSARTRCIIRVEVGGVGWNPYAIGRAGEQGAAQLHPRGLLPDFYRQGFDNPFDPYQAVRYVDGALARGLASHWAGVRLGRC